MATQKKKKSYIDQVLSGEYEYSLTSNNKSNSNKTTNTDKTTFTAPTKSNKKSSYVDQVVSGKYEYQIYDEKKEQQRKQKQKEKEEEEKKKTWFSSGAFSDGYQFGDVTKTILGTGSDAVVNLTKGAFQLGENLGDAVNYGIAGVSDFLGADQFADDLRKETSKSLTDKIFNPAEEYYDKYSVVGEKGDNLNQTIGNVLGIMATGGVGQSAGLGKLGTTILTTGVTGTSGFGGGVSEAYQNGATDEEAYLYGLISGTTEAGTEMIFGGLGKGLNAYGFGTGLSSADDMFAKYISKNFKNQTVKNVAEVIVKSGAEGLEEVIAGTLQAGGKKLTYKSDEDLLKLLEEENLMEQFLYGAMTSGIMQSGVVPSTYQGSLIDSSRQGRDLVTGYTQNEQAVIDKEISNRIAKAEANGTKLTKKQRAKIESEVIEDLENGYISTDSIENTLGGDTYTSLNEIRENKSKIEQEINKLENKPYAQLTVKENDHLKALREELSTIDTNTLESQLQSEMNGKIANDSYLQRSYTEKYNRRQKFTRNESEKSNNANINDFYTSMEEANVNNTKKTHDFGSFVSNIIKDKGIKARAVNYDILVKEGRIYKDTDEQYKFIENGKKTDRVANINGFKENGVLNINMQSSKAFEMTVGHELGEFIKDSDSTAYEQLKDIAIELGKADGSYSENTLKSYVDAYGELTDDATDEYVNDKLGELFDNDQFVTRISENRSLLRKIIDELKYLVEYATAGSSEKRKLVSLQHKLENKFREVYKKTDLTKESSEDTRFALAYFKNSNVGKDQLKRLKTASELRKAGYTKEDIWYRTGVEYNEQAKDISFYVDDLEINPDAEIRDGKTYKLSEVMKDGKLFETYPFLKDTEITIGDVLKIAEKEGYTNPQYLKEIEGIKGATTEEGKLLLNSTALDNIDQANNVLAHEIQHLIQTHEGYGVNETVYFVTDKDGNFYMKEASRGDSLLAYRRNPDEIEAEVTRIMNAMTKDQRHRYSPETLKKEILAYYDKHNNKPIKINKFLAELESKPKVSYSLSTDNQGRELTKEQQDFFKDSKVRDEEGNLITMYHGTSSGGHTVFDPWGAKVGLFGQGSYFTDNKSVAESYTEKGKGSNKQIYEVYLNITNPIDMDAQGNIQEWTKALSSYGTDIGSYLESGTNEQIYRSALEYLAEEGTYDKYERAEIMAETFEKMGYDGITHIGGGRFNKQDGTRHRVYISLDSNQIKNVDNTNPTSNPDIRYSLNVDNQGRKVSNGMQSFMKDSKARVDEDIKKPLVTVYHTMTDTGAQFNEFNPVGTDYYRFGEQVVNFFTDSKEMSGSYANQQYEMADTSKISSIDEVNNFVESFDNVLTKYRLRSLEDGKYQITSFDKGTSLFFENEKDLFEKVKEKLYKYEKQFGSKKGISKFQYEGYANITNPYVIDAQGEEWNSVEYGENTKTTLLQHTLTEEEKTSLVELAQESRKKYNQSEETINKIDKFIHNLEPTEQKIYYYYDYFTGDYENAVDLNTDTEQKIYTMYMKELVKREDWQSYVNNKEITANVYNTLERIRNAKVEYEGKEMPMSEFRETVWNTEKNRNRYSEEYFEKNFSYDIVDKLEHIDIRMTDFGSKNIENYQKIFKIAEEGFTNTAIEKQFGDTKTTNDIVKRVLEMNQDGANYDGVIIKNTVDYGGKASTREPANLYITFNSNQFKSIDNENPTDDADWRYSLGIENETAPTNPNLTYAEDVRLEVEEAIAPLKQEIAELKETLAPVRDEINPKALTEEDLTGFYEARDNAPILDAPPEVETVYDNLQDSISMDKKSLKQLTKNIQNELGLKRPQVAELEGIIQDFSRNEIGTREDLFETIKEHFSEQNIEHRNEDIIKVKNFLRTYPIKVSDYLKTEYKDGFNKVRQQNFNKLKFYNEGTEVDVAYDELSMMFPGYFPDDITNAQDQLNKIIEVANQEVIEVENFVLDNATVRYVSDHIYDSIQDYRLDELKKMVDKQTKRPIDESLIPPIDEELAPITKEVQPTRNTIAETKPVKKQVENEVLKIKGISKEQQATNKEIAEILDTEPTNESDRNKRKWAIFKANVLDKGAVFEDLSLKNKNRELMGKWDYTLTSEARGQNVIGNGHYQYDRATKQKVQTSKSLNDIRQEVDNTGLTKQFYEYVYHKHNVDRMTLDSRFGTENKPVFGEGVTASKSQAIVSKYEMQHPEFIDFAQDVYDYVNADRQELVNNGVISQETADLWQQMYPHYVPTRRTTDKGLDINVPLDTGRTGINAPVKQATGGNADILPLFDTMAMRTLQTYRATAKNSFGIELKNTLGTDTIITTPTVDEVIDSIDAQEELLQEGKKGAKPTFTVFENGEKVTFTITKDMYDAMKPLSDSSILSKTIKPLNMAGNFHRGILTEYNPVFMLTNAIKDSQDVFLNSQHSAKTYANIPEAYAQILSKGYWYQEYVANGGEQNSYFDSQENTFKPEAKGFKKVVTTPFRAISTINNVVEMAPRLAEYMASRKEGRSVEVSMLDASRVTTNFKAGGDVTKFLNRNGATFLNASVQGLNQQIRNFREANANGFKGWVKLASKFALAGIPGLILNNLIWEDDEDYEELSDYVKQNYYIVGKYGDGKFIRIPKGRAVAVIQNGFEQMEHLATGDDEADFETFFNLLITNLAPNNPIEDNVFAPIIQVANNKTWYGEDLVPTRLQDNPVEQQYDESTDMFSRWLGETFGVSPYKVNYLLDQYSGGLGDVFLPMMTPEAESGDDSFEEKLFAPVKNKFTADSVMNNQNVSDFYEKSEELTIQANKTNATDEDILRNKYMNSVKAEMNELYAEKREIQNSNLPDSEKYRQVREKQKEINNLSKNALSEYDNARIYDNYAQVGDRHYRINGSGDWTKINDKQLAKQERMTTALNINGSDYWRYNDEIYDIKADKDSNGESISGSRKKKVLNYINNLELDEVQKAILFKMEYPSYDDHNYAIINYVNNLDLSYEDKVSILTELDMEVDKNGNIRW